MANPFGDENSTYFKYQSRDKAFAKNDTKKKTEKSFTKYLNPILRSLLYLFILMIAFILFSINAIIYNAKTEAEKNVAQFNAQTVTVYDSLDDKQLIDTLKTESEKREDKADSAASSVVILKMKEIIDEEYIAGRVGVKEGMSTTQAIQNVAPYFATCDSVKTVDQSLPNMQSVRNACSIYETDANKMMDSIVRYNYFSKESIIGALAFGNNVQYPDIKSADIDDVGIFSDKMNNK